MHARPIRVVVMIAVLATAVVTWMVPQASASDSNGAGNSFEDEWGPYPVDFVDVTELLQDQGLNRGESFDPLAEPCPADYPSGQEPTNADITYKTFHRSQTSPAIPL
jgi:hypothetical protein